MFVGLMDMDRDAGGVSHCGGICHVIEVSMSGYYPRNLEVQLLTGLGHDRSGVHSGVDHQARLWLLSSSGGVGYQVTVRLEGSNLDGHDEHRVSLSGKM